MTELYGDDYLGLDIRGPTDDDNQPAAQSELPPPVGRTSQPPRKTPLQHEIDLKISNANNKVTEADRDLVAAMADPSYGSHRVMLTPPQAALIILEYNRHNRDLQLGKVRFLADAMGRGEWKWNHQGIAFYSDGMLGDGQHRCYACVLSGQTIPLQVTSDLSKDAIDTVDNQSVRNAGDACKLLGIKDPKIKARIMAAQAEYEDDFSHDRTSGARFTVVQIEKLVIANDEVLDDAIALARDIIEKVATPVQTEMEIATCALGMLRGGYPKSKIAQYTLAVNMGIGDYDDCPTTKIAKLFLMARSGENRKWRLSGRQKLALFYRGASLFVERKSVARMKWDAGKEKLPSFRVPDSLFLDTE